MVMLFVIYFAINYDDNKSRTEHLDAQVECYHLSYGPNCSATCSRNCAGDGSCHRESGHCHFGCVPGFYLAKCNQECDDRCGGVDNECEEYTGACNQCDPGWTGEYCELKCVNCYQNYCHKVTRECLKGCMSGYKGSQCNEENFTLFYILAAIFVTALVLTLIAFLVKTKKQENSSSDEENPMFKIEELSSDVTEVDRDEVPEDIDTPEVASKPLAVKRKKTRKIKASDEGRKKPHCKQKAPWKTKSSVHDDDSEEDFDDNESDVADDDDEDDDDD